MKKLFSILLAVSMVLSIAIFPSSALNSTGSEAVNSLFWVQDEAKFSDLFGVALTDSINTTDTIQTPSISQTLELVQDTDDGKYNAVYTFSLATTSNISPISLSGKMERITLENEFSFYTGTLSGNSTIDGVNYDIYAVVQKAAASNKMNAGVTMLAEDADSISDYIIFSIGDVVIQDDWIMPETGESTTEVETPILNDTFSATSVVDDYYFVDNGIGSFNGSAGFGNPGGYGVYLRMDYSREADRVALLVNSYCNNLEDFFVDYGSANITVDEIRIELHRDNNDRSRIEGFDFTPAPLDSDFSEELNDLVFDVLGRILPVDLLTLIEKIGDLSGPTYDIFEQGGYSYVDYDVNNNVSSFSELNFDDDPFGVALNLGTTQGTIYAPYTANATLGYFVRATPYGVGGVTGFFFAVNEAEATGNLQIDG